MPIKGLTDGNAAFPMIGKIRKGSPKQKNSAGKEVYGKDLDYFRFDSKDQKAIAAFENEYGDKPREIYVRFPHPTTEQNFLTCKEEWSAGGLVHRCDGEVCSALRVGNLVQRHFMKNPPCPYFAGKERTAKEPGCKEVGRLQVIIPALKRFAYVTVETHSKHDIINLHQQLKAVEMAFGKLNSLPFMLCRRPVEVSTPTDTGRARREKWLLSIEISPEWAERQLAASHQAAMEQSKVYLAIAPANDSTKSAYALPESDPIDCDFETEDDEPDPSPLNYQELQEVDEIQPEDVPEITSEQRQRLMESIASDIKRIGWTRRQGSEYLTQQYGKVTRDELTSVELLDFAGYLSGIATPTPVGQPQ